MPCYYPQEGYRSRTVGLSGKRGITFKIREGFADMPVTVACGRCIGCRLEHSRQWAMRLVCEAQLHDLNRFITLTYTDANLPRAGTLVYEHFRDFMKRLRRRTADKIRYYHCGEYGEKTLRPHYHAILFGIAFPDEKFYTRNAQGDSIRTSEVLDSIWSYGQCWIGDVSFESAAYVARYVTKKISGPPAEAHYSRVDLTSGEIVQVEPEYATMSRRPGIGAGWFEKYERDVYPHDHVISRGRAVPPPKFFDRQLEKKNPRLLLYLKARRKLQAKKQSSNNTRERLAVREEIAYSKLKTLTRKLG